MNYNHYILREFYLRDAQEIFYLIGDKNPFFAQNSYGKTSVNSIKDSISKFKSQDNFSAYVWEKDSADEKIIEAFVFTSQSYIHQGIVQVEFLLADYVNESANSNLEGLVDALLDEASINDEAKLLVFQVPAHYENLLKLLRTKGFQELSEAINLGPSSEAGDDTWLKLFVIGKTTNWPNTWVFIPTEIAVFAVYGDKNYISQTKWIPYDRYIEDIFIRSLSIQDGIANSNGYMKKYEESKESYKISDRSIPDALQEAKTQAEEYFSGRRDSFDLPLKINSGTNFQRRVWENSQKILYGTTWSYEELAIELSDGEEEGKNLSRAVGAALGKNPLCVLIPCHRIIAKDGKLQGYKYGVEVKDWLLAHEMLKWF